MLLTNVLDALPLPIAIFDRAGRYLRVNQRLLEISLRSAQELIGRPVVEVQPELGPAIQGCIETVFRTGEPLREQELRGRLVRAPDRLRTWHVDFSPLHDDAGTLVAALMVSHEVTEQLARERALIDNLAHLRRVLDSLFAFVGVLLPDGTLIEANRAPLQAAGIAWDDVIGRKFWDCHWWNYDEDVRQRCRDSVLRAATGEVVRFDIPARMEGSSLLELDYMIAPMRDDSGRITHLIPSAIDITPRVRTEQGLLRSERRFRQLFEAAPEGLAVVDEQGCILEVNAQMERLTGHGRQALEGSSVQQLIPDALRVAHGQHMQRYWTHPQARSMGARVLRLKRADGSELPVEAGLTPVPSEHGRQVLVTLTDCSQREAAKAQLEGALKEKTALLNEVHHRVKNNLQVVSSLLNLQLRTVPPESQRALTAAQGRVKAMALIHQLLYEGRDYAQIDLAVYLQRLVRLLRESYLAPDAGVELVALVGPQPVWLDLQRAVPCGLLVNELVSNALKHAFPPGRSGRVEVVLVAAHGQARLTVRDNGIGLPPQGEPDPQRVSLGLQLVPLLAEQLGASLTVQDGPGCAYDMSFAVEDLP